MTLREFSVNAAVRENTRRDTGRDVFLSGQTGETLVDVDATVSGNRFENVATEIDTEGTTMTRDASGEQRRASGEPPGDSKLDLLLYAATAAAVGVLFSPTEGNDSGEIMATIETTDLTKEYGDVTAVEGIDLRVERGDIHGFAGHNGAGKSTTMQMPMGLVTPTRGGGPYRRRVGGIDRGDPESRLRPTGPGVLRVDDRARLSRLHE